MDQVSKTQILLKSDDPSSMKLNEKVTLMMKEIDDQDSKMVGTDPDGIDETEDNFVRNRKTLTRKVSSRVKTMLKKRESLLDKSD